MASFPLICLMGPTASGKTELAVKLVQRYPLEIISVDSAMVYRGMDIGTAKPDAEILRLAPHRLINIREPEDIYSAAEFREDALCEIREIIQLKKIPFLVGGTMLYFRALQQGLSDLPSADPLLRKKISEEAETIGWPKMHDYLRQIDEVASERIHPNDSQRIQRAIEVYEVSGKNLTTWQQESGAPLANYRVFNIGLIPENRAELHRRIAGRFKQMIEKGFIEEVKSLRLRKALTLETPAMRSVGYRQIWNYLEGKINFDEMIERGIIATRQLAKRQLTWLRSWPELIYFNSEVTGVDEQVARSIEKVIAPQL